MMKKNYNKPNTLKKILLCLFPYTKIDGYFYIQDKNFVAVRYIQRGMIIYIYIYDVIQYVAFCNVFHIVYFAEKSWFTWNTLSF